MTFKELIYFLVDHDASDETIKDFCRQYNETDNNKETFFYYTEIPVANSDKGVEVYKCARCSYSISPKISVNIWSCCPRCGRKITKIDGQRKARQ